MLAILLWSLLFPFQFEPGQFPEGMHMKAPRVKSWQECTESSLLPLRRWPGQPERAQDRGAFPGAFRGPGHCSLSCLVCKWKKQVLPSLGGQASGHTDLCQRRLSKGWGWRTLVPVSVKSCCPYAHMPHWPADRNMGLALASRQRRHLSRIWQCPHLFTLECFFP